MSDGYVKPVTTDLLLRMVNRRKPNLTDAQKTSVANEAMSIYTQNQNKRWMRPAMAVKMAIFRLGF